MTISQANMRISAVDGTAFVDFSAAGLLTANIGKRLTVLDSTGKKLIGFIKAAGTGETLGEEKVIDGEFAVVTEGSEQIIGDDGDFDTIGNWGVAGSATLTAGYDSGDGGHEACLRIEAGDTSYEGASLALNFLAAGVPVIGSTFIVSFDYKWISKNTNTMISMGSGNGTQLDAAVGSWDTNSSLIQVITTSPLLIYSSRVGGAATNELLVDNISVKPVTFTNWTSGIGWGPGTDLAGFATGKAKKVEGTASNLEQNTSNFAGELYKNVFTITRTAGTLTPEVGGQIGTELVAGATITEYLTAITTGNAKFKAGTTYVGTIDNHFLKKVIAPSATGVIIVSTPGGAVFNWESKEAGFNYNDPAGYEYLITNQRAIFSNYYRQMRAA